MCRYDIRKYSCCYRVADVWNSFSKRNCIGTSNAKKRDRYYYLTMEMNERGYKIKGPH